MFRHDIREKPVLYKEILKAISKRELLEDLCFCACRKDHLPGVYRCHSWQAALLRYLSGYVGWPVPLTPKAKRYFLRVTIVGGNAHEGILLRCAQ